MKVKKLKKLKKLGYSLAEIIMIDDSPEKLGQNYGNGIIVNPFLGNPDDNELEELLSYLQSINSVENVREIEKRNWKNEDFPKIVLK